MLYKACKHKNALELQGFGKSITSVRTKDYLSFVYSEKMVPSIFKVESPVDLGRRLSLSQRELAMPTEAWETPQGRGPGTQMFTFPSPTRWERKLPLKDATDTNSSSKAL